MTATAIAVNQDIEQGVSIVGHIDLNQQLEQAPDPVGSDDFLAELAANPRISGQLQLDFDRIMTEIKELEAENRWDDIISLIYPVEEKLAEFVASGMAIEICLKASFALGRVARHKEAISCLVPVLKHEPDNVMAHYNMAYTALDALFCAKTARQPMPHREKKKLIETATHHFGESCRLRPDSVTFFYRHAILFKEIKGQSKHAIPFFEQAIANWEQKDPETRKKHHQQFPKYIKALYHLASCLLENGFTARSASLMEKVIEEDRKRNHMHPLFKHFAMGKVLYVLDKGGDALEHLELAIHRADRGQPIDFALELSARCCLQINQPERAAGHINKIPARQRRPYIRWTEAAVLVAQGHKEKALQVLAKSAEFDRRSRHKSLLKMAKINVTIGRFAESMKLSRDAALFCRQTFGNPSHEALFWQAASLYRLNRHEEAMGIIRELEGYRFRYHSFKRLADLVREGCKQKSHIALVK